MTMEAEISYNLPSIVQDEDPGKPAMQFEGLRAGMLMVQISVGA